MAGGEGLGTLDLTELGAHEVLAGLNTVEMAAQAEAAQSGRHPSSHFGGINGRRSGSPA
jgi:hypothetical protein